MRRWWMLTLEWGLIIQMPLTAIIIAAAFWGNGEKDTAIFAILFLLITRSFLLEEKIKERSK